MRASLPGDPLEAIRVPFRAIAATVVPDAERLDDAQWAELEGIVSAQLAARPAALRRQLALFVRLVDLLPLARHGRRFRALDARRRLAVLERFERSPLLL